MSTNQDRGWAVRTRQHARHRVGGLKPRRVTALGGDQAVGKSEPPAYEAEVWLRAYDTALLRRFRGTPLQQMQAEIARDLHRLAVEKADYEAQYGRLPAWLR